MTPEEKKEKIQEDQKYKILTLGKNIICNDHEFVYITGYEVKCRKCPVGYYIGVGAVIKDDGKIYLHGEKLML